MLEPREGETDVVSAIRDDSRLSDDQKQSLLTIYQSFVAGSDEELPG